MKIFVINPSGTVLETINVAKEDEIQALPPFKTSFKIHRKSFSFIPHPYFHMNECRKIIQEIKNYVKTNKNMYFICNSEYEICGVGNVDIFTV